MASFDTYARAREHARPGMLIVSLTDDGRVQLDEVR